MKAIEFKTIYLANCKWWFLCHFRVPTKRHQFQFTTYALAITEITNFVVLLFCVHFFQLSNIIFWFFSNLNLWRNVGSFSSLYKNSPVFLLLFFFFRCLVQFSVFFFYIAATAQPLDQCVFYIIKCNVFGSMRRQFDDYTVISNAFTSSFIFTTQFTIYFDFFPFRVFNLFWFFSLFVFFSTYFCSLVFN